MRRSADCCNEWEASLATAMVRAPSVFISFKHSNLLFEAGFGEKSADQGFGGLQLISGRDEIQGCGSAARMCWKTPSPSARSPKRCREESTLSENGYMLQIVLSEGFDLRSVDLEKTSEFRGQCS